LSGLIALGVTSTDAAMKRMGKRWKQLHRLVYPIGVLALLHLFIQTKANVGQPVFVAGLFAWLMVWRLLPTAYRTSLWALYALVPVSAVLTAAVEFAWYGLATKVDPFRILTANWSERFFPRPAHEVAAAALLVAVVVTARRVSRWRVERQASGGPVRAN
jgi:sulfoxide reductase heme-binding subunit YedZ